MLRGKRESLEASETSHRAYESEVVGDQELVDRVMKWLEESKPDGSRQEVHQLHSNLALYRSIEMESDSTDSVKASASDPNLYHPDFAEWTCADWS